jgi:hypothetical protein
LLALRRAVVDDIRELRGRLTDRDPATSRAVRVATLSAAGGLAAVVGGGLLGRGALTRSAERRRAQRQAISFARALTEHVLPEQLTAGLNMRQSPATSRTRRRRGDAMLLLAVVGAAAAGAMVLQQRRSAPVDPDDLWLPEVTSGPT